LAVPAAAGLDLLLVREAAIMGARGDWASLRAMWARARRVCALAGVGIAAAVAAVAAAALALGVRLPDGLAVPLLVALPLIPLFARGALQQAVAQGLHRPVAGLAAWSLARQLTVLAGAGVAWLAGGLQPAGAIVLAIGGGLVAHAVCARTLRAIVPPGGAPATLPARWARGGRPMAVMSSVTMVDAQLGLVALGLLEGAREAGLFAAATQATVGFVLVRNAGARPLMPLIARLHDGGAGGARLQAQLTRATRWVAAVTAAGAAAVCLLAGPLLSLFGAAFTDASGALVILALGHVVNAAWAFNGTVLTVTGHARAAARAATAAIVVNAGLLAILVPVAGLEGAAAAWLAGLVVRNTLNSRAVRRELDLRTGVL
jgi:O-antigen/teichoic acid export membrane protein